jgi:hypothetical protein
MNRHDTANIIVVIVFVLLWVWAVSYNTPTQEEAKQEEQIECPFDESMLEDLE